MSAIVSPPAKSVNARAVGGARDECHVRKIGSSIAQDGRGSTVPLEICLKSSFSQFFCKSTLVRVTNTSGMKFRIA
jgi:hypothetical protein